MAVCPNCGEQVEDGGKFCPKCGSSLMPDTAQQQTNPQQNVYGGYPNQMYNPYDHTQEFDPKDISANKVVAMLVYLLGPVGIIIALLGSQTSPYAAFHVRQGLKFVVVNTLLALIAGFFFWTLIIPALVGIAYVVLFVCKIICFFSICNGNAKEPPIIRSLGFLR